jgi:hypothetical protein
LDLLPLWAFTLSTVLGQTKNRNSLKNFLTLS